MPTGEYDPYDLDGQERQREASASSEELRRQVEVNDWAWLMDSKQGRRIVWRLLGLTGMYQTSFNTDVASMAYREGQRSIGLAILGGASADPEAIFQMQRERGMAGAGE